MLPSLVTLQLFVSIARQLSMTRGAASVGMTQSAATRRIANLETALGVALFERHRRGLRLTGQGDTYLAIVAPALEQITAVTDRLRADTEARPLHLRVYATFAMKWLLPRLPQFQALHPGLEVRLDTTVKPVSFDRDSVDLAIQFGDGHRTDVSMQLLVPDLIEPVCTPAFAQEHNLGPDTTTLRGLRLLDSHYRRSDWNDWGAETDIALDGTVRTELPNSLLAFQAAIEGLGLAMGQPHFLSAELSNGRLVAPFRRPVRREAGYYLIAPRDRAEPRRARLFRYWISGIAVAATEIVPPGPS